MALIAVPSFALAQSCPAPLRDARNLVLVTPDSMTSSTATLRRFTRRSADAPWQANGGAVSALIGRNGTAWSHAFKSFAAAGEPVKVDGDKRAPAGFFAIGRSFGFAAVKRAHYLHVAEGTTCVDDPSSSAYNTITARARVGWQVHGENMWRVPEYRRGLLVEYPTDRAGKGGSCIFIHVRNPASAGTAGCAALAEPEVERLQNIAAGGAVLAIVPRPALARFAGCLPK